MMDRVESATWIVPVMDDLDADFARFYRRDWWEHTGPRFLARAERVHVYGGAVAEAFRRALAERETTAPDEPPDVLDMLSDPAYAGMVEVG